MNMSMAGPSEDLPQARVPGSGRAAERYIRRVIERSLGAVAITRPLTCLMAAISAAYGIYLSRGMSNTPPSSAGFAMLSMACVMGMAHTVNDVMDLSIDRINKGTRPLPSGRLTILQARGIAATLSVIALFSSAQLGLGFAAGTAALLGLSLFYSLLLKGTVFVGNITVGVVCASTIIFGAAVGGQATRPAWVASSVVFLFIVAYETVKTLQDREADAAGSLSTMATKFEDRVTLITYITLTCLLSILTLVIGPAVSTHPGLFVGAVSLCLISPVWVCGVLLASRKCSVASIGLCLKVLRLTWFPGLTSLVLLS